MFKIGSCLAFIIFCKFLFILVFVFCLFLFFICLYVLFCFQLFDLFYFQFSFTFVFSFWFCFQFWLLFYCLFLVCFGFFFFLPTVSNQTVTHKGQNQIYRFFFSFFLPFPAASLNHIFTLLDMSVGVFNLVSLGYGQYSNSLVILTEKKINKQKTQQKSAQTKICHLVQQAEKYTIQDIFMTCQSDCFCQKFFVLVKSVLVILVS